MKRFLTIVVCLLGAACCAGQSIEPASRILTYKQYAKLKHDTPYVLEFKVGKGALLIFGSRHLFDPKDVQVADIIREWDRFRPDVAYNEGGDPPTRETLQIAVERHGEAGLLRFLAARDSVPVATFEPRLENEIRDLRMRYSPEQVKVWDALRAFLTFRSSMQQQTTDEFMVYVLNNSVWRDTGLADRIRNVAELQLACDRLLPGLKDWRKVPEDWFDPTQEDCFLNEMQNDNGMFRDQHIFKVLTKRAERGDRVFAVIGASHVPVLEPALGAVLGPPVRRRDGPRTTTR